MSILHLVVEDRKSLKLYLHLCKTTLTNKDGKITKQSISTIFQKLYSLMYECGNVYRLIFYKYSDKLYNTLISIESLCPDFFFFT